MILITDTMLGKVERAAGEFLEQFGYPESLITQTEEGRELIDTLRAVQTAAKAYRRADADETTQACSPPPSRYATALAFLDSVFSEPDNDE